MNINDAIHTALGSGHINDLLLTYYQSKGATSNQTGDAEREFLIIEGATAGSLNDMWLEYLSGYAGSINDKKLAFWLAGATT